ncbi:MAG: Holliday junction branch migration protein RuvA [Pseudomonadales bacterium]|nr:Holliday junction branch migration protein RuvA [Pseudomonadales bacterium]
MIGWIKGFILQKQAPHLLLNVNGVGYELQAPMTTFYTLPEDGEVELYTHFVVREDAQLLYGFATTNERRLFRELIKVNGVGPKLALSILSTMETQVFVQCVQIDDVATLVKIPGIGKKTAERLLVEMRDRLKDWFADADAALTGSSLLPVCSEEDIIIQEATAALITLGYKAADANKMVAVVNNAELNTTEALIKAALQRML